MFKKTVMAAAMTAVASSPAMAYTWKDADKDGGALTFETNVTLYAYYLDTDEGDSNEKKFSGDASEVEFKGSYILSDEVKVFGEIEFEFDAFNEGSDSVDTDDMKLGIDHDVFGKVTIGQFDPYYEDKIGEALDVVYGDGTNNVTEVKTDDPAQHLQYLKEFGDTTFVIDLAYVGNDKGDAEANDDTDLGYAITIAHEIGAATIAAGYNDLNKYGDDGDENSIDTSMGIAVYYDLSDDTELSAVYATQESHSGVDTDLFGIAAVHGIGDFELAAAVQQVDEDGEDTRTEFTLGASYEIYKDLIYFIEIAHFDKDNGEDDQFATGFVYEF
jgi:predicted porin